MSVSAAGPCRTATRRRAVSRGFVTLAAAAALLPLTGCATKRDVKDLRDEIVTLQVRQDSLFRVMQMQNRMLLDTIRSSFNLQQNVRGDLGHQISVLNQGIIKIEELLGQQAQQMAELRMRTDQAITTGGAAGAAPGTPASGASAAEDAATYYELGRQKMAEGSYATARIAFEGLLREFAQDALAPDAQFQLAESYYLEGNRDRALAELERVPQQWPASARAPQALFRAGVIAQESNQRARARDYFERIVRAYPDSDERRQAEARLRALR